tara:strand:- start:2446 stop:2880 length:435 start_codon:yes stop_codon:yes gene_type:complete
VYSKQQKQHQQVSFWVFFCVIFVSIFPHFYSKKLYLMASSNQQGRASMPLSKYKLVFLGVRFYYPPLVFFFFFSFLSLNLSLSLSLSFFFLTLFVFKSLSRRSFFLFFLIFPARIKELKPRRRRKRSREEVQHLIIISVLWWFC